MRREIYEQPASIAKTVDKHLKEDIIFPGELDAIESALLTFEKLIIAASGSSRHAGLAGEIMMEVEGETTLVAAGSGIRVLPGKKHQIRNPSSGTVRLLVISQPRSHGDRIDES